MKTKVIAPVLFIAGLLASTLTASAQISEVWARNNNHTAESLVLGITAYSSGTFVSFACNWSSPSSPASLSTSGTMSGGPNDGYNFSSGDPELSTSFLTNNASNGSGRGVIRGKNNNGGTASTLRVGGNSSNAVTVVIWGPTLNSFGITGATNFTWTATGGNGYSNSGSSEGSFTVPQSAMAAGPLNVVITPSNDNELGSVMVNLNN